MSVLNLNEEMVECPLCMEPLEMDDLNFFPCTCGYQICRFCWHRIRTDENGLCPACRKAYPENPADFKPLSHEELQRIKQEKRQKDAQRKQKVTENRKHLANVRVVQKNLVFVVGLSTRLADAETLKKPDYFGKFGKIHKVVINHSTSYAGSQGPSASAYVTYQRAEDALRAIQAVNNIHVDGRTLKASLGTTKYCSHFMKNQQCPKPDCMYLHELGDESASFTKEEMQQGKHQEFEKKLQEQYLGNSTAEKNNTPAAVTQTAGINTTTNNNNTSASAQTKRANSGGGKENSAPKGTTDSGTPSGGAGEAWPTLNAAAVKEGKKSKGSKGERNSSSTRNTPTEEHNNNNNISKRGSKERERCSNSGGVSSSSSNSSTNSNGSSTLGVDVVGGCVVGSPIAPSSSPSSGHQSCSSSASTTPPPPFDPPILSSSPPPCSSTSPMPLEDTSPLPTPPSSLSSSSEPSSSLPPPQQFSRSAAAASLFSDNSNSFFSSGPSLPLQRSSPPLPTAAPISPPHHNNHHSQENNSDWTNGKTTEVFDMDSVFPSQNHTASTWNCIFDFEKSEDLPNSHNLVDDELGFDPFEETNKALAEDIKIEQKQQQQQLQRHHQLAHQLGHHSHIQHQQQQQTSHTQQQQQQLRAGLKSLLDFSANGQSRARLPPPGFNGLNYNYNISRQSQPEPGKLLPPFMNTLSGNPNMGAPGMSSGPPVPPPINGMVGSNGLGVPPGLGGNMLSGGNTGGIPGGLGNGLPPHLLTPPSLLTMDPPLSASQPPPGLSVGKGDTFLLKDLENGLRNMFPTISSVSTMNTLNTVNTLNSLAGGGANNTTSQNNPLTNFINMAQQQQQQQQHQHPAQQSLLQQLTLNSIANSHKGWTTSNAPDLTVLDPAIVSSGQPTDSRSDSPPHWMKTMEQISEGSAHPLWNNLIPYNMPPSSGLPPPPSGLGQGGPTQRSVAPIWPPTSPPPGFNTISPLHHPKHHQPHKIENL